MQASKISLGTVPALLMFFALLLCAPLASASIDAFGGVHGRDKTILRNHFLHLHHSGYRIVGYHASNAYRHDYAGVYYLHRAHGEFVDSGAAIYHHVGSDWRLIAHPSKRLKVNLEPDSFFYTATVGGSGEYKLHEGTGLDEPETASSTDTDIQFTLGGTIGGGSDKFQLTGYQEEPEPPDPQNLLTGKGKTVYSHPISAEDTPECEYAVANSPSDTGTQLTVGWRGATAIVRLDLGNPEGGGGTNCGGKIEDPKSEEPGVEIDPLVPHPPLGRPFTVPLRLEHAVNEAWKNAETGAQSGVYERSLAIHGALSFHLAGLEIPRLN